MRKILISILVCLLLVSSTFLLVNGMSKINVKGFKGLSEKNEEVELKITELSNIVSTTYVNTESNLKRTAKTLQESKVEYENQAILSQSAKSSYASQLEAYDIDYLWTKLGNFAKEEGVVIKIELVLSGTSSNLYNLNFTVTRGYVNTTNFIYDIENDSKLGFKIDDFKMGATIIDYTIVSTFSCKDIPVKVGIVDGGNKENANETNITDTTKTNTETNKETNTTTNTPVTNTTNTTNTINTTLN